MSYNLNSLKKGYIRIILGSITGSIIGLTTGDSRTLDYGSNVWLLILGSQLLGCTTFVGPYTLEHGFPIFSM